jgi:hypothetical protein
MRTETSRWTNPVKRRGEAATFAKREIASGLSSKKKVQTAVSKQT